MATTNKVQGWLCLLMTEDSSFHWPTKPQTSLIRNVPARQFLSSFVFLDRRRMSILISRTWCPSTSSRCRPPPSGFCSFSSFSVTIAGASSISMSRSILRQSGPRSRSLMLFRGIRRCVTCCETGMESTGRTSNGALRDSTSSRFRRRRAPRGRAPTSNGSLEAFRRECLDHVIILDERHLRRILRGYVDYYHSCRTHLSLEKDAPEQRPVQWPSMGRVTAIPKVGGLHHYYSRLAA